MKSRRKRLLAAGVLLVGLAPALLSLVGLRIGHIRFLVRLLSEPPTLSTEETAELHAWLRNNAVHLQTVAAGSGFDDMQPLKAMIGDARIVGLGEATHMNRDFSRVKHRMIEFLVCEMGFTVFAIEAPFADALEVNDYILNGNGTAEKALAALRYRAWRTESILEMIQWMRQYNATHESKIRFYGFDDKPATSLAEAVYRYLKTTNGTEDYNELLSWFMENRLTWKEPRKELPGTVVHIKKLIAHLESQQPTCERPRSEKEAQRHKEWSLALQHARVLLQNVEYFTAPSRSKAVDLRDKHMAENVRWLMDYERGARMILWAANPHVNATPFSGCMGAHLRRMYGKDMVVFGLLTNRCFQEEDHRELSPGSRDQVSAAPKGTVEALLAAAGLNVAAFDLRSLPKGAVFRYFHARRKTGSTNTLLPWAYDAIVFLESTTVARPVRTDAPAGTTEEAPAVPAEIVPGP